ncbi:MAG TPA: toll/interleukin-1 receptor domain-containing protein [Acidobacteriaceae bacterium]
METRPVLVVYVVWHPGCQQARGYARTIFKTLYANPAVPASRGLGVPVKFRTATSGAEAPARIPFGEAQHTAVFVFADDELAADPLWRSYADGLVDAAGATDLVVPIAITATRNLPPKLAALQAIRLNSASGTEDDPGAQADPAAPGDPGAHRETLLLNDVMHDLCRLLDPRDARVKVKVFLSHAKADGLGIANPISDYLRNVARLEEFFDATDIPNGTRFAELLKEQAGSLSALLAIQTDSYASREWCRLELLEAKRRRVPIVVLSALQNKESRSFPYIGNVPVVRWRGDESLPVVVGALLGEVLRDRYFPRRAEGICKYHGLAPERQVFSCPPELMTLLAVRESIRTAGKTPPRYLYPDPPLGTEELQLLQQLEPGIELVTPTDLGAG